MRYELRFKKDGEIRPLGDDPSLTDDQELALSIGTAQLFRVNLRGEREIVLDVDDITEISRSITSNAGDSDTARAETAASHLARSPLLAISVVETASSDFVEGQRFATLEAFDEVLRVARASASDAAHALSFLIEWKDGSVFEGSLSFAEPVEYLIDHVVQTCGDLVNDPQRATFAAITLHRIFSAAMAETLASKLMRSRCDG